MTTTTNTAQGLLADIIEHPEDDDLRLIYADFLDDHDEEERAEFIRSQVELYATYGKRLNRLRPIVPTHECVECGALWERHYLGWSLASDRAEQCCDNEVMGGQIVPIPPAMNNWFKRELELSFSLLRRLSDGLIPGAAMSHPSPNNPLPYFVLPGPVYANILFRRGFVAEIHAPLAVLQQHLPALVRQHPIERVRATDKEPEFFEDLSNPWTWWRHGDRAGSIGSGLWAKLDGHVVDAVDSVSSGKDYPTAEAAHEALSVALLTLARR